MDELQNASVPAILLLLIVKYAFDAMAARRERRPTTGDSNGIKAVMANTVDRIDQRTERTERDLSDLTHTVQDLASTIGDLVSEMRAQRRVGSATPAAGVPVVSGGGEPA